MNKRLISFVLTFIMLITMVPSTIVEASEVTTMESVKVSSNQSESNQSEVTKPEENTIYAVNPLYEDVISIDDLMVSAKPKRLQRFMIISAIMSIMHTIQPRSRYIQLMALFAPEKLSVRDMLCFSTDCARKQGCRSELSVVPEMEDCMRGT